LARRGPCPYARLVWPRRKLECSAFTEAAGGCCRYSSSGGGYSGGVRGGGGRYSGGGGGWYSGRQWSGPMAEGRSAGQGMTCLKSLSRSGSSLLYAGMLIGSSTISVREGEGLRPGGASSALPFGRA